MEHEAVVELASKALCFDHIQRFLGKVVVSMWQRNIVAFELFVLKLEFVACCNPSLTQNVQKSRPRNCDQSVADYNSL